eukprot:6491624-Amphidinium_carterae.1
MELVNTDNRLMLLAVLLATLVAAEGGWMLLEHPEDAGEPHTSFWVTELFGHLQQQLPEAKLVVLDACMLGQVTPKPTAFFTTLRNFHPLHKLRCQHTTHAGANGSAQLARWPKGAMVRLVEGAALHWEFENQKLRETQCPIAAALDLQDSEIQSWLAVALYGIAPSRSVPETVRASSRYRHLRDGLGTCSAGRYRPELRSTPLLIVFRTQWLKKLRELGALHAMDAFLREISELSGEITPEKKSVLKRGPFTAEMLGEIRKSMREQLELPAHGEQTDWNGQPFQLDLLDRLACITQDPDTELLAHLGPGVPLGVTETLMAPEGTMVDKNEDSDVEETWPELTQVNNYPSASVFHKELRENFMDDVKEGLALGPFCTVEDTAQ